jgi:dipeptidase D
MSVISSLEPSSLWSYFDKLNAVPRASKKEARVIQFMLDFGSSLNLQTLQDEVGNVIIRKPATTGMEDRKIVTLQSHLDMVHQKNSDTAFDFDKEGIKMYVDGDWVKAEGTTLGADNGIGVATIMALLASTDIAHPRLEALFTIDEETGMTGALGLKGGLLEGNILLNLDTEEDDELGIGCAGGMDVTARGHYDSEVINDEFLGVHLIVKGLQGGHSGVDIHKGFGNANKITARILYAGGEELRISSCQGGSLRNAIPRESEAFFAVKVVSEKETKVKIDAQIMDIKREYASLEPNLSIEVKPTKTPSEVMSVGDQRRILNAIIAAHNGVFRMSPDIKDLVESSNNVARVEIKDGKVTVLCLTRSSVDSTKIEVAQTLRSVFELAQMEVTFSGDYPGWTPNLASPILATMKGLYKRQYGQEPTVAACHAGLECGILGRHYPDLDMISYGPTIKGAHSPDERVCISSVQKFWSFTLEVLKAIPKAS